VEESARRVERFGEGKTELTHPHSKIWQAKHLSTVSIVVLRERFQLCSFALSSILQLKRREREEERRRKKELSASERGFCGFEREKA